MIKIWVCLGIALFIAFVAWAQHQFAKDNRREAARIAELRSLGLLPPEEPKPEPAVYNPFRSSELVRDYSYMPAPVASGRKNDSPTYFEMRRFGISGGRQTDVSSAIIGAHRVRVTVAWTEDYRRKANLPQATSINIEGVACQYTTIEGSVSRIDSRGDTIIIQVWGSTSFTCYIGDTHTFYYKGWDYSRPEMFIHTITILE